MNNNLACILIFALLLQFNLQAQDRDSVQLKLMYAKANEASALMNDYEFREAVAIGNRVFKYAEKHNDKQLESIISRTLGISYYSLKKDSLSFYYLFKARDLRLQLKDTAELIVSYTDLGAIFKEEANIENSNLYLNQAIDLGRGFKNETGLIYPLKHVGFNLLEEKKYHKALGHLKEAMLLAEKDKNLSKDKIKIDIYAGLYEINYRLGNQENAKAYLNKAIVFAKHNQYFENLADLYKRQTSIHLEKDAKLNLAVVKNKLQEVVTKKYQAFNLILGVVCFFLLLAIFFFYKKNQQFMGAKEEAERLSRAKSDFYSEISHELRTPLYAVIELSRLLLRENVNPNHKLYLESLNFSGSHLLSLINNVLELNKVESGKIKIELVEFNLKNLLSNIIESIEYALNDSKNVLHLNYDERIPMLLYGDSLKLSQVFINLISNAIKFTDRGNIYVNASFVTDNIDSITILFEVKDDGVGIPKEKQGNVFEDFYQENTKTEHSYKGTGLGLSIVKRFVNAMESEIIMKSEEKKGSSFSFELVVFKSSSSVSKHLETKSMLAEIQNQNILIVDDNKINQLVTKKILDQIGAKSTVKSSGEEAVEAVLDERFDCVLMDINMPGLNGYEATALIRKFDKHTPVIALTASSTEDVKLNIGKFGMNGYVLKPFLKSDFIEAIYSAIYVKESDNS